MFALARRLLGATPAPPPPPPHGSTPASAATAAHATPARRLEATSAPPPPPLHDSKNPTACPAIPCLHNQPSVPSIGPMRSPPAIDASPPASKGSNFTPGVMRRCGRCHNTFSSGNRFHNHRPFCQLSETSTSQTRAPKRARDDSEPTLEYHTFDHAIAARSPKLRRFAHTGLSGTTAAATTGGTTYYKTSPPPTTTSSPHRTWTRPGLASASAKTTPP